MQVETIQTERFAMNYCRFGQGKRKLVILPGLSVQPVLAAGDAIAQAYSLLAEDFTLYLFERRSDLPESYSVQDMAEDTACVFRALDLGPVCLFGASQGGMMAMEIAIRHPELVERLILGSTSAYVSPERYELFAKWIRLAREGKAEDLYLGFSRALFPESVFEAYRAFFLDSAKTVTKEELSRFIILAEGLKGFDLRASLGQIACPVLVIGSEDDKVLGGEASRQIARGIPGSELKMYEAYGHAAYDVAPDYREQMLRFFTR